MLIYNVTKFGADWFIFVDDIETKHFTTEPRSTPKTLFYHSPLLNVNSSIIFFPCFLDDYILYRYFCEACENKIPRTLYTMNMQVLFVPVSLHHEIPTFNDPVTVSFSPFPKFFMCSIKKDYLFSSHI